MMAFHFLDGAIIELEEAAAYYERQAMQLSVDLRDETAANPIKFTEAISCTASPICLYTASKGAN
jgi:hypothetical protein